MRRRDEVAVGVLLTIATAVVILGTLWLARGGLSTGYPLYTKFRWGQNLKQGQPVTLAGVRVGYVGNVDLRYDGYLDVMLRVDDERKIPLGSIASVEPVGIFGDVQVALLPKLGPVSKYYSAGDTVPAGPPTPSIGDVLSRVDSIGQSVNSMMKAMQSDFVQAGALRDLRTTIGKTAAFSAQLQAIAAEQNSNLSQTLAAYRRAASALDSARIEATLENLRLTSSNITRLTADLDSGTARLNGLMARVDRGEGTVGKLLTDTLLYHDIRGLVGRTDSLLADFKANPKKYINLRIF
jgi:phospholipid/cholesterol/gamma-HCH transport system substrate-binding protein